MFEAFKRGGLQQMRRLRISRGTEAPATPLRKTLTHVLNNPGHSGKLDHDRSTNRREG
jgi:hypothetical protein